MPDPCGSTGGKPPPPPSSPSSSSPPPPPPGVTASQANHARARIRDALAHIDAGDGPSAMRALREAVSASEAPCCAHSRSREGGGWSAALALAALLDEHGVAPDARPALSRLGYTALMCAAEAGQEGVASALLARGADRFLRAKPMLLQKGRAVSDRDLRCVTARELATRLGHDAVAALLEGGGTAVPAAEELGAGLDGGVGGGGGGGSAAVAVVETSAAAAACSTPAGGRDTDS